MEVSHTAANITKQLGEVADSFGIPYYKRVVIVYDNGRNMKLYTEMLTKEPEKWGNVQGVCCSRHKLQLFINVALKEDQVRRTVPAARNPVGHLKKKKKSPKATAAQRDKQQQQNVAEHKVLQDVATRWNSTCT